MAFRTAPKTIEAPPPDRGVAANLHGGQTERQSLSARGAAKPPGISVGMSLSKLAELLMEFGTVDAINLDGGGSTTMFVRDKVVNRPSDQTGEAPRERRNPRLSKGN